MYTVKVRDHIMIAHSLPSEKFGPAQHMHGATYVVDVSFMSKKLTQENIVIDIAAAHQALKEVLGELNYKNLDEHPDFTNQLSTTEYIAKYIHNKVKDNVSKIFDGKISVTLGESHVAWASYADD